MQPIPTSPDNGAPVPTIDPTDFVNRYVQALHNRDLAGCLDMYADDATLTFLTGVFKGRKAIEGWHKERFAAEGRVVKIDSVRVKGDTITADLVVTSKRLVAWKIGNAGGRATFRLDHGKIKEVKLTPRLKNPLEGI